MIGCRFGVVGLLAMAMVAALPQFAWAHPGHGGDFRDGWHHPWSGLDHLLAMLAVGLLAARMGDRALWVVPGVFLGAMLLGGVAAGAGLPLPGVETGILASVVVLGGMVAVAGVAPIWLATAVVAIFAFFHGHAHGAEMTADGSLASYALGFLLATAILHATGIVVAVGASRWSRLQVARLAGAAIAACGLLMFIGLI